MSHKELSSGLCGDLDGWDGGWEEDQEVGDICFA